MTVFIWGNSHTIALAKALNHNPILAKWFSFAGCGSGGSEVIPFSALGENKVYFSCPSYAARLTKYLGRNEFLPTERFGLCIGTHNARIYRQSIWLTAAPSEIALKGQRQISEQLIDTLIQEDQKFILQFLNQLNQVGVACFIISCPAPRKDGGSAKKGIPLETIRWIDHRARQIFQNSVALLKIPIVESPEQTIDDEGFLRPEYSQLTTDSGDFDSHHANEHFGKLMLEKIVRELPGFFCSETL